MKAFQNFLIVFEQRTWAVKQVQVQENDTLFFVHAHTLTHTYTHTSTQAQTRTELLLTSKVNPHDVQPACLPHRHAADMATWLLARLGLIKRGTTTHTHAYAQTDTHLHTARLFYALFFKQAQKHIFWINDCWYKWSGEFLGQHLPTWCSSRESGAPHSHMVPLLSLRCHLETSLDLLSFSSLAELTFTEFTDLFCWRRIFHTTANCFVKIVWK